MTPHSYLISITVLSEASDYRGVMGAVIGLAPLVRVRERGGLPTSLENAPPDSSVLFDGHDFHNFTHSLSINQCISHLMHLFFFNTQVGF